jgi:hypothetical protein
MRPGPVEPKAIELEYDFSAGRHDWQAGLTDYNEIDGPNLEFRAELRALPDELNQPGMAFFVQSRNTPDDLFMLLKRKLDAADGIEPGTTYRVSYEIVFASNAPSGCSGIGGAPGESVFFKAGASSEDPRSVLDQATLDYRLNVDKGNQAEGGPAASVAGDVANGREEGCDDLEGAPFVSVTRTHEHDTPVTAADDGSLWLLIGTDSGFEGTTQLYYQSVNVRLEPVP